MANKPAYLTIADDIRAKIEAGVLRSGDKLPTKRQMAKDYEVSGQVIDSAMLVLKLDGTVQGRQGKGIYVAERPDRSSE